MALLAFLGLIGLVVAIFAPQFWIRRVMKRHSVERPDFPGTGGELARHLVDHFNLKGVTVETTQDGADHYDPETRTVRLSPDHFNNRSLTAVAVAAHEVGHALQHANGERGLALRQALAEFAAKMDRVASVFFIASPVLTAVFRTPAAFFGMIAIGIGFLAIRLVVHLATLPVEYDASFGKALPILQEGGYLSDDDLDGARSVLKAAAMTYVAGALVGLINLARWIAILR